MLADMGADVIKVEAPGTGDPSRHNAPHYKQQSVYFGFANRNKRSIELDLRSEAGREAARRLIATADVMLESYSPGVAAKLGIDYETARKLKPDIIYCSISGFGQDGPLAASSGHDMAVQALAGVISTTGGGEMPQFQAADYAAAAFSTIGILSALYRRRDSGEGAYLDVSMLDSLLAMGFPCLVHALSRASGGTGLPALNAWGNNPRYAIYPTRDQRHVAVALLEAGPWKKFCEVIGRPDLIVSEQLHERLSDHGGRSAVYRQVIGDYCAARTMDEIEQAMRARDIPVCPVLNGDEALASPQVKARGMVYWDDDPHEGRVLYIGNPLTRAGFTKLDRSPPPLLGEHTESILRELGLASEKSQTKSA